MKQRKASVDADGNLSNRQTVLDAFSIGEPLHRKLANAIITLRWLHNTKIFTRTVGAPPNYVTPRAYTEKMQCRKLFHRNPLYTVFCNKLAARAYAEAAGCGLAFPEVYWCGEDPDQIPFDRLPKTYIVKPNHRSGDRYVVRDNTVADRSHIRDLCRQWLKTPFGQDMCEWGYRDVERRVYVEQLLVAPEGMPLPEDYKLHIFSGRFEYAKHMYRDHDDGTYTTYFDRNWQRLKYRYWAGWARPDSEQIKPPGNYTGMIEAAERLAGDLDHVRVDFYEIDGTIYFGELTLYEGSGFTFPIPEDAVFDSHPPRILDFQFGAAWQQAPMSLAAKLWKVITG